MGTTRAQPAGCESEAHTLACELAAHARSLYLRRLEIDGAPYLDVEMEVVPGRGHGVDGELTRFDETEPRFDDGGHLTLEIGEEYRIRFRNAGTNDAFVNVLGLYSDGSVDRLYPNQRSLVSDVKLKPGQVHESDVFRVGHPAGLDMLKLFATSTNIDFRSLLTRPSETRLRGDDALADLFGNSFPNMGIRGNAPVFVPTGTGATCSVVFRVESHE